MLKWVLIELACKYERKDVAFVFYTGKTLLILKISTIKVSLPI